MHYKELTHIVELLVSDIVLCINLNARKAISCENERPISLNVRI